MKYNLKVAKAWTKENLDKWLEGFEAELREMYKDAEAGLGYKPFKRLVKEILGE